MPPDLISLGPDDPVLGRDPSRNGQIYFLHPPAVHRCIKLAASGKDNNPRGVEVGGTKM